MDDTQATTIVETKLSWLRHHERLILAAMLAGVLVFGTMKVESVLANKADAKVAVLQQQVADDKDKNAALALQSSQTASQYQSMVDALSKQNASLAASVAQRQAGLAQQQQHDQTLPPSELAKRWEELIGGTDVQATTGGYSISSVDGLKTVTALESIPVLTADLADETKIAQNTAAELGKADSLVAVLGTQIGGLQTQIVDADKEHKAEIKAVRAEARKSKFKWFLAGLTLGFLGRGSL